VLSDRWSFGCCTAFHFNRLSYGQMFAWPDFLLPPEALLAVANGAGSHFRPSSGFNGSSRVQIQGKRTQARFMALQSFFCSRCAMSITRSAPKWRTQLRMSRLCIPRPRSSRMNRIAWLLIISLHSNCPLRRIAELPNDGSVSDADDEQSVGTSGFVATFSEWHTTGRITERSSDNICARYAC